MNGCLDASALVPLLIRTAFTEDVLEKVHDLVLPFVAPSLVFAESTNALRREVKAGRVSQSQAALAMEQMLATSIRVIHELETYRRALAIAAQLGQSKAYDALYLATAERTGAILVTADRAMHHHAGGLGLTSRLLTTT